MRKTVLFALAAVVLFAALPASEPVQAKGDPEDPEDYFQLYRYAGRKWMLKRTPKPGNEGGDDAITYHQFEVLNVWDDRAEYVQTSLDEAKRAQADGYEIKIDFDREGTVFKDPIGFKKQKREKVKTDAGTFDCIQWLAANTFDGDARIWRSIEFPGLVVKQDDRFGTRELVEFRWCPGESGYKGKADKKKKKKKDDEPEEIDSKRLFGGKGNLWVLKTETVKGERDLRSWDVTQYEITAASDSECTVEITKLTQLLQKVKGEDPIEQVIKFDDSFQDHLEPSGRAIKDRTEKRITEVGLFECTIYTYKDEEGREGRVWYANEWPGLIVRRVVKGEQYSAVTEIVKFEN